MRLISTKSHLENLIWKISFGKFSFGKFSFGKRLNWKTPHLENVSFGKCIISKTSHLGNTNKKR